MRLDLLDAAKRGRAVYDWCDVTSGPLTVRMTTDAAKVDGVRATVTAQEAQLIADELGCLLPTAKLLDLRHVQAAIKIAPHTQADCPHDSASVVRHSRQIDADIASAGHGSVSPTGKHWILDHKMSERHSVLYGWHVLEATWSAGRMRWRGIPLHQSASIRGQYVIQPVSIGALPGAPDGHGYHHHDYSMMLVLCHPVARLRGRQVALCEVLTSATLSDLVIHGGQPLPSARLPGVPEPPGWLDRVRGAAGSDLATQTEEHARTTVAAEAVGDTLGIAAQRVAEAVEDLDG